MRRPGRARLIDEGATLTVEIQPEHFDVGRFERIGAYEGGALAHAYGGGDGWFEWRFRIAPATRPQAAELILRLSSEFPGTQAPPDGDSRVVLLLDGVRLGELDAPPDDGAGRVVELAITDAALLERLGGGEHVLRIEVPDGKQANGVCIYGEATGRAPPPVGEATPIRLVLHRAHEPAQHL
jgi:hypothetical protein